jgi:CRISPR-associated protein Csb2
MLTIEIEYLTGVVFAGNDRGDAADWPPQPDRAFSALVASWAARGRSAAEREALEWLEGQPAPRVMACDAAARRSLVTVFVPPNDDTASSISILPDRRSRQPRRFPACVPTDPIVYLVWDAEPEPEARVALASLAADVSYLGHSASLVRCHVRSEPLPPKPATPAKRGIYRGRFAELELAFAAGHRPNPGAELPAPNPDAAPTRPRSIFGRDWLVFRHEGGTVPDAVAAAIAAKTLLKAVLAGYGEGAAPLWASGHAADGSPTRLPHLACVPLLDVGWRWSAGGLMGLALVLPRDLEQSAARANDPSAASVTPEDEAALGQVDDLYRALARQAIGRPPLIELGLPGGVRWFVAIETSPAARSLQPVRYATPARRWGTVTPIALDRHPRADGDVEAGIVAACERIGLPAPRRVVPGKQAAPTGARPARRSRGAPDWANWRLPPTLQGRPLMHAVLEFEVPVEGPVVLGAGRFNGLGLCLPLDREAEG